jgi:hypothetical protein
MNDLTSTTVFWGMGIVAGGLVAWFLLCAFYLPFNIYRRHSTMYPMTFFLLNTFFAWTLIGWFILLLVALNEANRRPAQ